jgi:hypothetical protein
MSFFQQFPKIQYDLQETNVLSTRFDIFRHVDVTNAQTDSYSNYLFYDIKDGERPDVVSQKLYNTPDYYWTFFIINDFLQAGFNKWYKSQLDFYRGLELEYDDHGALIFIPNYSIDPDRELRLNAANVFGGLDVTTDGLRLVRTGGSPADSAKIKKFDPFMQQLITFEATSDSFYDSGGTYHFGFSSDITPTNRKTFLSNYLTHLKKIGRVANEAFNDLNTPFAESDLSTYTYTPERAYSSLLEAPYRFKASDNPASTFEEDEEIGALDALLNQYGSISNFKSWFDYEYEENEKSRKIIYISPFYIERFVDSYKNLINS